MTSIAPTLGRATAERRPEPPVRFDILDGVMEMAHRHAGGVWRGQLRKRGRAREE